jgi:hypothetical protein
VLSESSKALGGVHSGVLSLGVLIEPSGGAGKHPFGFELKGPFQLGDKARARMTYTQIANGRQGLATIVLGENGGYIESNGTRHELTAQELTQLRGATREAASGGGLQLDDWATSVKQHDCGDAICVDGDLDPAKALAGVAQLQQQVTASVPKLKNSDSLKAALRSSRYHLVAAKDGKLPRSVSMTIDFHKTVPPKLRRTLGSYVGAKIDFDFSLARANEDVGLG